MKKRMTAAQLAEFYRSYARRLKANVAAAERESAAQLKKAALAQSSGTITTKVLRRMGHPFALRSPQTPVDPAKINRQSGEFKSGWRTIPMRATQAGTRTGVVNATLHARYLKQAGEAGSSSVARPIAREILLQVRADRRSRLRAALQRTQKGL
jgi:hypothetical protein